MKIKVIAFDADDTLWENEIFYRQTESKFCELLSEYLPEKEMTDEFLKVEVRNMKLYGYGVKAFTLSMIETALGISNNNLKPEIIESIIKLGKSLIEQSIELIDDVEKVLEKLKGKYILVLATKGDLLDQERKLKNSGLEKYFDIVEVMSNKKDEDYQKIIKKLDIKSDEFLMIGNSPKSDILPVLNIGGNAIYIPSHTTWVHERIDSEIIHPNLKQVEGIIDTLNYL